MDNRKGQLDKYIPPEQRKNINIAAFNDIEQVFMNYLHTYGNKDPTYWVCDAAPGHGKTTVLKCLIKWMIDSVIEIPLLIVTREISLANEIYAEITRFKPGTVANVNSNNKELIEQSLPKYQFIIIQQARFKNLALGYGNSYLYNRWSSQKRCIINDEKPVFDNGSIFDVGDTNNCCDWFDNLYKPIDDPGPTNVQLIRDRIINIVREQIRTSTSGYTMSIPMDLKIKSFLELIRQMKRHKENAFNFSMLQRLCHFEKIITTEKAGRIDEYQVANRTGKKIIVSEYIDYRELGMNILILDGTCHETGLQYRGFKCQKVKNRNDYSRLHFHIEEINTSNYSRSKVQHTTQQTIAKRIKEIHVTHNDLYVLSTKNDKSIYSKFGIDYDSEINLLNTTGKNGMRDRYNLYLTSLPKRHADYYKSIALAYHPDADLSMCDDPKASNWFNDNWLESLYRGELYAEINQIIHRTALRYISKHEDIHIFIAYDEDSKTYGSYEPICVNINQNAMDNKASIETHKIIDLSLYNRMETVVNFAESVKCNVDQFGIELPCRVGKIDKTFQKWLKNHWKEQGSNVNQVLTEFSLEIYVDENDRKSKKVRYIN